VIQKRYQKVTRKYCNQVIDLLSVYFLKSGERSPSDTASTQRYISRSSSMIIVNAFSNILFQSLITFHLNTLDRSNLVRILRTWKAHDARNTIQTDGLVMTHRPMSCSIPPADRRFSG